MAVINDGGWVASDAVAAICGGVQNVEGTKPPGPPDAPLVPVFCSCAPTCTDELALAADGGWWMLPMRDVLVPGGIDCCIR